MPTTLNTNGNDISVAIWFREQIGKMAAGRFYLLTVVFSIAEADIRSQMTNCFNVEF